MSKRFLTQINGNTASFSGSVAVSGVINASDRITSSAIQTGIISSSALITASSFSGDGSLLTNLPAATVSADLTLSTLTASGRVTASAIQTGIISSSLNIFATSSVNAGNINVGNFTASGTVSLPGGSIDPSDLSASTVTIGSTAIGLGGTSTTLTGLTALTSNSFTTGAITSGTETASGRITSSAIQTGIISSSGNIFAASNILVTSSVNVTAINVGTITASGNVNFPAGSIDPVNLSASTFTLGSTTIGLGSSNPNITTIGLLTASGRATASAIQTGIISASARVTASAFSGDGSALTSLAAPPTAAIIQYAGSSAPTGYLLCNGLPVSRTTYAALFAIISTTYGSGNGSTTFNVPNLQGVVPVGAASAGTFTTVGSTGGVESVTLTGAQSGVANHTHPNTAAFTGNSHGHTVNSATGNTGDTAATFNVIAAAGSSTSRLAQGSTSTGVQPLTFGTHNHTVTIDGTTATGTVSMTNQPAVGDTASAAHTNLQPYIVLNYIIKT